MFWFTGKVTISLYVCVFLATTSLSAQVDSEDALMKEANRYFQDQEWQKAVQAFQKITEQKPDDGQAWFYLGLSYHSLQQYDDAVAVYLQAEKHEFVPPRTRYNLACAYSLKNEPEKAFEWLEKAIAAGFNQVRLLETDSDLENIRDGSRFAELVEQADRNARPCEYDPKRREFDFWLGEWDVFNPQGQKVGTNIIEKKLNGCLIFENWTSAGGGSGKSMNYYDPADRKWKQSWVSAGGGIVWYEGEVKNGAMHFRGENISADGTKALSRVILRPIEKGRIHHFIEHSKDGGRTWTVYFDGTYVAKDSE